MGMDTCVFGKFGMKGGDQDMLLTGHDRLAVKSCQNLNKQVT